MPRPPRLAVDTPPPPSPKLRRKSDDLLLPSDDPLGTVPAGPSANFRDSQTEGVGLSDFLGEVGDTLRQAHGMPRWVRCELTFIQLKAKGYWVLGLQETDEKGQKKASAEAMVWSQDADRVIGLFERSTGTPLTPGMQVLLRVELSFSPQWGLRLLGKGIDPQWTVGAAAQAQQLLRKNLQETGLWDLNRTLPAPEDFTRIAILAPQGSAGIEDFLKEAERLEGIDLCQIERFYAAFEGNNAALEIPRQLESIASNGPFDAVFIVRGGGAAAGIAWLNQEAIVRAAAQCPFPLVTGIGHERDTTLLDEMAHTQCGTPSKAAGHLVGKIVERARAAETAWTQLQQGVESRLTQAEQAAENFHAATQALAMARLDQQMAQVDALIREAVGLGPQATLERGYALLQDPKGQLITSKAALNDQPQFRVVLADGSANASLLLDSP